MRINEPTKRWDEAGRIKIVFDPVNPVHPVPFQFFERIVTAKAVPCSQRRQKRVILSGSAAARLVWELEVL